MDAVDVMNKVAKVWDISWVGLKEDGFHLILRDINASDLLRRFGPGIWRAHEQGSIFPMPNRKLEGHVVTEQVWAEQYYRL